MELYVLHGEYELQSLSSNFRRYGMCVANCEFHVMIDSRN